MKITSTRLIYIQPVMFKTISFHHQSEYYIQFELKYRQPHIKQYISAYPTLVNHAIDTSFNKKKIIKLEKHNKIQTEKFLILFNDQSITLKGGCNFVVQTDRISKIQSDKTNQTQTQVFVVISLMRQHCLKGTDSQLIQDQKGKIQKVGESTVYINLNVLRDYSQYSSYRHIVFTKDEYFSSFLFYIDFAHMGINIRASNRIRMDQLNCMQKYTRNEKIKRYKNQIKKQSNSFSLRSLLQFKQLKKLYKLLISDRLEQFKRLIELYHATIDIRQKYINTYEIQELENIQSMNFHKKQFNEYFIKNLNYLYMQQHIDNQYFYSYYQTDNIDQIYVNMYNESKLINLNVRKVWDKINILKLKTLPQQFMNYALKYKIDRITYITQFYSTIDQTIFTDQLEIKQRILNHQKQRKKVCQISKFYNSNQLKHSMLTFHSQKNQNIVISNTSQKNQFQTLVVLVHGYQGSQRDMAKIKSFINTFTAINFLPLQTLKNQTNNDIATLGKKGAQQIIKYLEKKPYIQSINIIGFSLGGIIAKAILTNMQAHKHKFNLFMSLSSPHLGISELQNCLVSTGVMWMKKVTKSKNIIQLCCEPLNKKQKNITLVSLSQHSVLDWFNHVVLIGSNEDTYVPKYSSLLAYRGNNQLIENIQKNTLKNIKSLDRITVWFEYQEGCLQKLTGKKGHISFIQDDTFLEYIITKYLQFF